MPELIHFEYQAGSPELPPVLLRSTSIVEVLDEKEARAEFLLVKPHTDTTLAEYDLVLYLHAGTVDELSAADA